MPWNSWTSRRRHCPRLQRDDKRDITPGVHRRFRDRARFAPRWKTGNRTWVDNPTARHVAWYAHLALHHQPAGEVRAA